MIGIAYKKSLKMTPWLITEWIWKTVSPKRVTLSQCGTRNFRTSARLTRMAPILWLKMLTKPQQCTKNLILKPVKSTNHCLWCITSRDSTESKGWLEASRSSTWFSTFLFWGWQRCKILRKMAISRNIATRIKRMNMSVTRILIA